MLSRSEINRAFAVRLDLSCRHRGKSLNELAREAGKKLGRHIRPDGLPTCGEREGWLPLMKALAEILEVDVAWLACGESSAPSQRAQDSLRLVK